MSPTNSGAIWGDFEDESGFSMTPPTARTWAGRGHTPVIRVRSRCRISIAALTCYIWSLLRRGWLSNTVFATPIHRFQAIRHGLDTIQHRSHRIDVYLAGTGLSLTPTTTRVQAQ